MTCFQAKGLHISITVGVPTDPWVTPENLTVSSRCHQGHIYHACWQARILLGWALVLKSDCQDLIPIIVAPEPYSQRHLWVFSSQEWGHWAFHGTRFQATSECNKQSLWVTAGGTCSVLVKKTKGMEAELCLKPGWCPTTWCPTTCC